jgi:XRE family transcriptional regulator, regulator of sulfur utilization
VDELASLGARIGGGIRARRHTAGHTLEELASRSGLSKTILSRIENGRGNPSVETLFRIARALGLPLSALLEDGEPPAARRIPARSGTPLLGDSGMSAWLILSERVPYRIELIELDLPAGVEHPSDGHLAETVELVYCTRGRLRAGPIGEEVELAVGDCAWFRADTPHHYIALRDARALNLIGTPG